MDFVQASLVIGGHSHIAAFAPSPVDLASPTPLPIDGATVIAGPLPRDDGYWDAFVAAAEGGVPVVVWAGDQHLRALLIEPSPPLDFVLSAAPDLPLDPRASYVAEAQLRALFEPALAPLAALVERLRAASPSGIVLVAGTPPPIGDVAAIQARLGADPQFAPAGESAAVTSPYTLQKAWSLLQGMLAETAGAAGATFVWVPDRTRDAEGFLVPACWSDDPVHANATYAHEMLADLRAAIATLPESADR